MSESSLFVRDDGHEPEAVPRLALLRVDAGLRAAVPPSELAVAERVVLAPRRHLDAGAWAPEALDGDTGAFAALLVRGLLTHEITIAGRRSAELCGPGDVLRPWPEFDTAVPRTSRWGCDTAAEIAVLDDRFVAAARRWPGLFTVLHERLAEQLDRGRVRAAIMALPRVEQRVMGLFWQLADRWGTVRPDGIVVGLELRHELIGQLIGAQRPTVSLALHALARNGLLQRTAGGDWLLGHDSRDALGAGLGGPTGPVVTARTTAPGPVRRAAGG